EGSLSNHIQNINNELVSAISLLELELDFSEEEVEFVSRKEFAVRLQKISETLERLVLSYRRGKLIKEGLKVVIVGKPNVGKSSLLNALLREDRAIVTDIPGTTRDVLEELIELQGNLFRIADTAGMIDSNDIVEKEGIRRSERMLEKADIVLAMFDASRKVDQWDEALLARLDTKASGKRIIIILNKIDAIDSEIDFASLKKEENVPFIEMSVKHLQGFVQLERELLLAANREISTCDGDIVLTNNRHEIALKKALESLKHAIASVNLNLSQELIVVDLRAALDYLGEIIGLTTSEDILNEIFSKFCIGK
ncbi:GTP-binding protein, partial [candidate division KSB1 bacterium]|nr:GTP-binding protein [candidate division KSB1 bacterium]